MAIDPVMKRPLTSGQFAWAISKKSGSYSVIFGPDPMDATDDELFVLPSRTKPMKVEPVDFPAAAIQDFILLNPGDYAVIYNPTENFTDEHPNGPYSKGRNEVKALKQGTKRVVTSGYFPVWPGQKVEVRQIHTLSSNQFLMAVVESENIDTKAPYYELTLRCASIKKAVVNKEKEDETDATEKTVDKCELKVGQRIIIPGNLTPTYVPPSGIEILPEVSIPRQMGRSNEYEQMLGTNEMVRQAVVLGPTEFCVLLDEDGQPQVKKGPGRVFPGPYHVFRTKDSRNNVYDAYHLRPDRGILLRIVVDSIAKDELAKQLPQGSKLEKETYTKGDEIFIFGFDAYLIPSQSIEVIDPKTRQPHIGNNHSSIYVQAVGVDQKSGVYVADVETGNVKLVRGEKKLILDPRKECHVRRKVPTKMWNLIIGKGEPHKTVNDVNMVETPWALSVVIPNNEAVLVTSKSGRRAEVGPKTILLEYEEWLEVLQLSRGRPKNDHNALETCYLRVSGNRISDQIVLETEDFVDVIVDVQYGVEFVGETEDEQIQWFNYKDYVKFFCSHLRSRLRASARKMKLADLYSNMADFVRDIVLGEKPEGGHRPGLLFKENNMKVTEVDVSLIRIPDGSIADSFDNTKRQIVVSELNRAAEEIGLINARRANEIANEKTKLQEDELVRRQSLSTKQITIAHDAALLMAENRKSETLKEIEVEVARLEKQFEQRELEIEGETKISKIKTALEAVKATADRLRKKEDFEAEFAITQKREEFTRESETEANKRVIELREKLNLLELALIAAGSEADAKRLEAIQPGFIEALEGIGNKQVLTELASSLPAATGELGFLLGSGGFTGVLNMLSGTPLVETLKNLKAKVITQKKENE